MPYSFEDGAELPLLGAAAVSVPSDLAKEGVLSVVLVLLIVEIAIAIFAQLIFIANVTAVDGDGFIQRCRKVVQGLHLLPPKKICVACSPRAALRDGDVPKKRNNNSARPVNLLFSLFFPLARAPPNDTRGQHDTTRHTPGAHMTARKLESSMPAKTMAPSHLLAANLRPQSAGSWMSTVPTCQARCVPAAATAAK